MATPQNLTNMETVKKICCSQCRSACNSLLCSTCEAKTINIVPVKQDKDNEVTVIKEEQPAKKRRTSAMNYLIIQCLEE